MNMAPSVECPVGPSVFEQRCAWLAWGVWSLSQAVWWWYAAALPAAWWLSVVVASLLVAWQRWRKRQPVDALLRWTGADWMWFSQAYRRGTPLNKVFCALDFQRVMLLRVENAAGVRWWVWLEPPAGSAPQEWAALRRAVYATRQLEGRAASRAP